MSNVAKTYVTFVSGGFKKTDSSADSVLFANVGATTVTVGAVVLSAVGGALDVGGVKVVNALAATTSDGLATKGQMDTADNLRVLKAGDSMTGNLAMGGNKVTGLAAGTVSGDAVEYAQFIAGLAGTGTSAEWQNSVVTATLVSPVGLTPTAGDRYLINGTGTSGWTGKDNQIATYVSGTVTLVGSWTYQIPTTGTFTDADDESGLLYYFGGSSWSTKSFEATTASGFLDKTGFNITLKNLANGKIIVGDGSGVAQAVTPTGDVTTSNTGVNTIANDAVTTVKILNANVTDTKLATDSVTTIKIVDANVTDTKLATDSVTTAKILALNVTTAKLAATSVTAAKPGSDVAGSGLTGGNGSAIAANAGDGIQVGSTIAVNFTEQLVNDNAGAITVGQLVYLKTNGHVDLATAVLAGPDTMLMVVQATSIAAAGTGAIYARPGARVGGFSSLTPGKKVYAHNSSAGGVTQDDTTISSGNYLYTIGRAISATEVIFQPQFVIQN
jgi:hypothetical protein